MKKIFSLILLILLMCSPCYAGVDFTPNSTINCGTSVIGVNLSISAWINTSSATDAQIVSKDDDQAGGVREFQFRTSGTKLQTIVFIGGNVGIATSGASVNTGSWVHVAGTYDGTTIRTYINGSPDGTDATYNGDADSSDDEVGIGARLSNAGAVIEEKFDGQITEVCLWNTALTADEISLLYSSRLKGISLQIKPANLKLYLPLDDHASGTALNTTVFKDLSGNGNDGTGVDTDADSFTTAEILNYPPAIGQFN